MEKWFCRPAVISVFLLICVSGFSSWAHRLRSQLPQSTPAEGTSYPPPIVTPAEFDHWMKDLSNWGRWGKDDQLGAVNLITAAKRKKALSLVKEGVSISLAHSLLEDKAVDNGAPFERQLRLSSNAGPGGISGASDRYSVAYHGRAHSHIDALCHVFYQGRLYNGFSSTEVTEERGCEKNSIQNLHAGIMTRAVLIDIPRLKSIPYLDAGTPVSISDIEAWEKKAGVKVGPGDAILLRTGRWARREKLGPYISLSGYHATVAPWFKTRDVALVGSDGVQDVGSVPGVGLAIHIFVIAGLGANIMDNLDLETVADTAAKLNRWEFLLTIAPLAAERGTGSPVNPIATF